MEIVTLMKMAAPAVVRPTNPSWPLVLIPLTLPAPHLPAHTSGTTTSAVFPAHRVSEGSGKYVIDDPWSHDVSKTFAIRERQTRVLASAIGLDLPRRGGLNQRFWSIHRFAFLRATLSASLQLLQISVDSPHTVVSSSWFSTDFHMRARGSQRASTRLWEQALIWRSLYGTHSIIVLS